MAARNRYQEDNLTKLKNIGSDNANEEIYEELTKKKTNDTEAEKKQKKPLKKT